MKTILFFLNFIFSTSLLAADIKKCDAALREAKNRTEHEFVIIPSGGNRDADVVGKYHAFVEKMSRQGGVLDQLGIPRTKQVIEFVQGVDMLALTATPAAAPVAHFLDGAQILNAVNEGGYIYEVVYPGATFQHGYYRDDTSYEEQLSIIMHVVGHNHFAVASSFPHYRASNPTEEAHLLNEAIKKAYRSDNKEDVEDYYLFMQTLTSLTDTFSAYYQAPEDFSLDAELVPPEIFGDREQALKRKKILERGLKSPTENVMAAFVHRIQALPVSAWQKSLLERLPLLAPYRPALVHQQVMNEGWASIMQEIVMDHMGPEHNTLKHWFSAQQVMRYTDRHLLQDPYWLGVRVWRRLRELFFQRPEIASMSSLIEKDYAFIRYAEDEVITKMDDVQFLNYGLDDHMIQKMGLVLTRKALPHEMDKLAPPPPNIPNPEPVIIVSRDPERIRKSVIELSVRRKFKFRPRVVLKSFNRNGSGEVELSIDDDFGRSVAIDNKTVGPALYALSNIIQQPVSLVASFVAKESLRQKQWWEMDEESGSQPEIPLFRWRIVVHSSGKFEIFTEDGGRIEPPKPPRDGDDVNLVGSIYREIEKHLHEYLLQMHLENDAKLEQIARENPRFDQWSMHSVNQMINNSPITSLIEHVPAAAEAINEYQSKVSSRLLKALLLATTTSHGGLKRTSRGLYVKALPGPVNLNFNSTLLNRYLKESKPLPLDAFMANPFDNTDAGGDLLGPSDRNTGRGGWIPGPGRGGPGQPGEGDEEETGSEPGDQALDPTWVPLPEELYAQFLGEKVKLPRLNPKTGRTKAEKQKLRGRMNRRYGQLMPFETAVNALRKGIGGVIGGGGDPFDDIFGTLEEGFSMMRPRDYVVRALKPFPKPDTNAVVIFARDASGSTTPYNDLYKRFVFDMKTLIQNSYPHVTFKYIIFDHEAHIVADEDKFFRTELGGGTSYKAAVDKINELMATDFPAEKFDRFPFVIGDLGDMFSDETQSAFEHMVEEASYSGVLKAGWGDARFAEALETMKDDLEYFGYVDLGDQPDGYSLEHMRHLLKNKDED